jgi:cytochrome c553
MAGLVRALLKLVSSTSEVAIAAKRAVRTLLSQEGASSDVSARRPLIDAELKYELWKASAYFAIFLILSGVGGFLVAVAGIVPINASSGHWAITRWFLDFSSQRSVAMHALGVQVPSLNQPGLVLRGAGAYEMNCRACHGSPYLQYPKVAQAMTPNPPYLPQVLSEWNDAELFYVVKHGIKFTGMPAWPAQQRDDEVWAMVAFLRTLPNLETEEYGRLVNGESVPSRETSPLPDLLGSQIIPRAVTINCGRCHGVDGRGRGEGAFPKLAGQSSEYIFSSLEAFASGQRHSGVMEPIAAALNIEETRELALYYSQLPKSSPSSPAQASDLAIQRGMEIAERGIPAQRVPSCIHCHGRGGERRNPNYPDHSGQYAEYLVSQLVLFKNEQRGGTAYAHLMNRVAANLNPQQMRDVALYYSSQ